MSNKSNKYTYNGESDFLEWYKNNYDGKDYDKNIGFIRPDGMSDAVWDAAMLLYNSYTQGLGDNAKKEAAISNTNKYYDSQKNSLLQNYSTNLNALAESKQRAQENASITLDKLKKYLPTQMKMQGLSGLGISESSALQAYNNYMNEMGDITANYDKNKTTLDTEKTSAENNLEKYRIDDLTKINTEYDGYERTRLKEGGDAALKAYSDGVETEQGNNFAAAKTYIESYSGTDAGELEKYITDTYSGKVSDSQLENLKALGRSQVMKNVEIANKKVAEEKDLVLESTIIPQLNKFEANGEWDKALSYLDKNKDYFTNQSEYEVMRSSYIEKAFENIISPQLSEYEKQGNWEEALAYVDKNKDYFTNPSEYEAKRKELNDAHTLQLITSGELSFNAPGDTDNVYLVENPAASNTTGDINFITALKAIGIKGPQAHIPNGTTIEFDNKFGNHYCLSYIDGEWYNSKKFKIKEHHKNRRYGTSSSVTAQPGATSHGSPKESNLENYLK